MSTKLSNLQLQYTQMFIHDDVKRRMPPFEVNGIITIEVTKILNYQQNDGQNNFCLSPTRLTERLFDHQ